MEDQEDYKEAPIDTGVKSTNVWKQSNWSEIGRKLGVSRQRVQMIHEVMLIRLKRMLLEDPQIKEWLDKNDYEIDSDERSKNK